MEHKCECKVSFVLTSELAATSSRIQQQAAVVVSVRHLQEVLTLQKSLLVLFRTLHQAAAFVTIQKLL